MPAGASCFDMGTELLFKWGARTYLATVTVVGKLVSGGPPWAWNRVGCLGYLGNLLDAVETYWMPWIPEKDVVFQDSDPPEAAPG